MSTKFVVNKKSGQPYEVVERTPKGSLFIRPMGVIELTEELVKTIKANFTHAYGHIYTAKDGRIYSITSDVTQQPIPVREFVKGFLYRDADGQDFEQIDAPLVRAAQAY